MLPGSLLHRRIFVPFLSNQRCLRTSSINFANNSVNKSRKGRRIILSTAGFGIAFTGLYFILVNGPSRSAPTSSTSPLSPWHFTPVTVTASIQCTPYTKLLTFKIPRHLIPAANDMPQPVYSIYVKDSDIQIERPYTPLEGIDEEGEMHFWVKRYQGGEVGRWLHERKVGEQIEIRGPIPNWPWRDGEWDEIVMISGGTGITPFYQLLHHVFSQHDVPQTRFTLLHSSPRPSDLPPGAMIDTLRDYAQRHPGSFTLELYVDALEGAEKKGLFVGRIGREAVTNALVPDSHKNRRWWERFYGSGSPSINLRERRTLFLVCGPEPMVAAIAGPRGRNLTQGGVGGVLGELGAASSQVFKL